MTVRELAKLVAEMRAAQRQYFRLKSTATLDESIRLERLVDRAVREVLEQPRLLLHVEDSD
jgi:hypothetical protein